MDKFNPGWFVIYTKPRHEKKIVRQLEDIQISHYLPVVKKLRTWSDRKKYIDSPLFPSYVFVRLENMQNYFRSLEIDGVLHYLRTGKQIATVSENLINNLKMAVSQAPNDIEVSSEYICPGTILYIREGPFVGFCCEVIQHKGKQKILVRIELIQRNILLDLPAESLIPVAMVQNN